MCVCEIVLPVPSPSHQPQPARSTASSLPVALATVQSTQTSQRSPDQENTLWVWTGRCSRPVVPHLQLVEGSQGSPLTLVAMDDRNRPSRHVWVELGLNW